MNKTAAKLTVIAAVLLAGLCTWYLFSTPFEVPQTPEPIRIGTTPLEVSGLIFIAEDQGYFGRNGISPTIRIYDAGVNSMDALYAGDIDIATAADFVFTRHSIGGNPVRGIAIIGKSEIHYIIARKDRGIRNISDLKGKKIGVARGTSGDFFLGRFLELEGMSLRDVEVVDILPAKVTDPLAEANVDAVSTWDPYAYEAEQSLGDNVQVWPEQKGRLMYWIAICREDYVAGNPARIQKFLKSLQQAEKFTEDHPDEARSIIQKRLQTGDRYMSRVWPSTQLSLSLDQSLVLAMEDEARWMIKNNLTDKRTVPDFRNYIYRASLEEIKPGSVRIIG